MTKKNKGEVKVSVKGNPFGHNPDNQWNFGVWKTEDIHVEWDVKQIIEILKKLGGKG